MELLVVYPGSAAARPGAHARPRRVPVEGRRRRPRTPPRHEPPDGWAGAVVACDADPEGAWALCRALRKRDDAGRAAAACWSAARSWPTSSCATTCSTTSASRRSTRSRSRRGCATCCSRAAARREPEMVEYSGLALNLETYQASIEGRPLDLTYMEYELLKFLAQNPGKVFTREMLLSAGVGLRVLRRRPHGRRAHPPPARQARRGAGQPDPDRPLGRLPLRPEPLGLRSDQLRRAPPTPDRRTPACPCSLGWMWSRAQDLLRRDPTPDRTTTAPWCCRELAPARAAPSLNSFVPASWFGLYTSTHTIGTSASGIDII